MHTAGTPACSLAVPYALAPMSTSRRVQSIDTQVEGFRRAVKRWIDATGQNDADGAFMALFEALNWVTSIDERLGRDGERPPELLGHRWVRNAVHHLWADAVVAGEPQPVRQQFGPIAIEGYSVEWLCRPAAELPSPRNDRGLAEYQSFLEGRHAGNTLLTMQSFFDTVSPPPPA
jgi:hypothetical protein